MSAVAPEEDALELEVEEFRELYAEDVAVAVRVREAVLRDHPGEVGLAHAVVDSLIAGSDMHVDEDPIVEVVDACRRLVPLARVLADLRSDGQGELASLIEAGVDEAGRWLHEGGWAIHDDAGVEIAFVFSPQGRDRTWVLLLDGLA